jgi:hypothetical protein
VPGSSCFDEQAVRLAELAIRGFRVSGAAVKLAALDVYVWPPALSAGSFNKPQHLIK